jgi:hypothetical protein
MRNVRITGETSALNVVKDRYGGKGRTLGSYLTEAVNGELPYDDPFGGKHVISLAPFAGEDPNLFLRIRFVVSREDDEFDPDYSDAVVLKEFELPTGTPLPGTDEIA